MDSYQNHPLPLDQFEVLASQRYTNSVSIYLPMDKKGLEQNRRLAQAKLKSNLKQVSEELESYGLHETEVRDYLKPIEALVPKVDIWRNPADGMAIFLNETGMKHYLMPIPFESKAYISDHFYLLPLLPLYHGDGKYHVLELSQDYIRLYEASRYHFKDLYVEDLAPGRLEEAVGYDYEQKALQFRSGHAAYGASFHGQGAGKEDSKEELERFLRLVDEGVLKATKKQNAPMILACVESLCPVYKEVSRHPNLYNKVVPGDPEFRNKGDLHKASWELIAEYFDRSKLKLESFDDTTKGKIASLIPEIARAAETGKVDTLLLQENEERYGTYELETHTVRIAEKKKRDNISLTNRIALKTFLQGGHVYSLPESDMPHRDSVMNALFRY